MSEVSCRRWGSLSCESHKQAQRLELREGGCLGLLSVTTLYFSRSVEGDFQCRRVRGQEKTGRTGSVNFLIYLRRPEVRLQQ